VHICQEAQQRRRKIPESQSSAACTHGKKEQASARKHTEKPVQRRPAQTTAAAADGPDKVITQARQPAQAETQQQRRSLAAKLRLHAQPKRRDHREPDLAGSS